MYFLNVAQASHYFMWQSSIVSFCCDARIQHCRHVKYKILYWMSDFCKNALCRYWYICMIYEDVYMQTYYTFIYHIEKYVNSQIKKAVWISRGIKRFNQINFYMVYCKDFKAQINKIKMSKIIDYLYITINFISATNHIC